MYSRRLSFTLVCALALAAGPVLADQAIVTATSANVRAGADTTQAVRGTLLKGTTVEILETSGEWHHIRTLDGAIEGWVSARLLERRAEPRPAASAPVAPPPAAASAGVAIEHRSVSCLVAEQFPRLDACFAPSDSLARAQVLFRASDTSPWFAVDMRKEGNCFQALLPKPKRTTRQIQYFVHALDRAFAESQRPEGAPGKPFTPRVVEGKGECQDDWGMGSLGTGSARQIVVSVARDSAGRVLNVAASTLGSPAQITGFSAEGVVMGQPAAASNAGTGTQAAAAGGGAAAAGGGFPVLLVAGGAAGAVAVVAVAAGGGGSDSATSSSTPSSSTPASLSGAWSGTVASGRGLTILVSVAGGGSCTYRWDVDMTLTQSGNALNGPATSNRRSIVCSIPELQGFIDPLVPHFETFSFASTLSPPNAITIPIGEGVALNGTYTATTIDATAKQSAAEGTIDYKMVLTKR